jgi:apolipoprotein N-acyltransferase
LAGKLRAFGAFAYDFVIGDDWLVAVVVAVTLAVLYALTHAAHLSAWWLMPVVLVLLLPITLWRAVRKG